MSGEIIVAVDPRDPQAARDAIVVGGLLAGLDEAPLRAVTVVAPHEDERSQERALTASMATAGVAGEAIVLAARSPARALHEIGDRERPLAIVIGSGRRSIAEPSRLGAVAEPLLHGGAVPVVVVPRGHAARSTGLGAIGVAFDGTPEARDAWRHGEGIAGAAQTTLRVLTIAEDEDDPAEALAEATRELDLLVAGSRSYGPLRAVLLGRTTRRLLPIAHCPVMIVPRVPVSAEAVTLIGGMEAVS